MLAPLTCSFCSYQGYRYCLRCIIHCNMAGELAQFQPRNLLTSSPCSIICYIITQVILIGSRLWSIRGQTHRWRQRSIQVCFEFFEFWIWTNHNSLLSIATNQFASFFIDIRSPQCYFHVCQSDEIWNNRAFFPCILIFLLCKTNRFHVAVRLFSYRSQRTSNCGKNISDTRLRLVFHFFVLTSFWRHLWPISLIKQQDGNVRLGAKRRERLKRRVIIKQSWHYFTILLNLYTELTREIC